MLWCAALIHGFKKWEDLLCGVCMLLGVMHLHCSESHVFSIFGIICSKVCIAVNPGRHHSRWIICWWKHERNNIAGDELPVSVVGTGEVSLGRCLWWDSSAGQTRFAQGCSGAFTDSAHGDVWREGRLKPPGCFFCPLQSLSGCTLMEAFQKVWLAEEASLFTWEAGGPPLRDSQGCQT